MSAEVDALLDEVRRLLHRVVQVAESLHADEPITLGMRAVLEFLLKNGPTTVPDIARSRHVTRQHIQALVNALLESDLVALLDNPSHRRSPHVALTPEGESVIRRMKKREARLYAGTDFGVSRSELRRATATLAAVRRAFGEVR